MTTWNLKGNSENCIVGISVDKNAGQPTYHSSHEESELQSCPSSELL